MKIQQVSLEWVPRTWPMIEAYIAASVEHAKGDYNLSHLQAMVSSGQAMLVVAVEEGVISGAAIVEMFNRPSSRIAFILALGGSFICNEDSLTQFKNLVASLGATSVEAASRDSVFRLVEQFGFKQKYKVFAIDI
jgi:hypothetical protein